jgi:dolichol-phosphate mannosyltransferase
MKQLRSLADRLLRWRYIRFGLVGASGTVVNMAVLALAQEVLLVGIAAPRTRLLASLAMAILVSTINNFSWNRLWTWADRRAHVAAHDLPQPLLLQFARYCMASWLGIALQYGLTLWLSQLLHYLLANAIAIVLASVSNFIANDRWTFRHRPPQ